MFIALLAGTAGTLVLSGHEFVISWVDLVALGLGGAGLVRVVRTREVVVDRAMWAYAALLGLFAVQAATTGAPNDVLGGVSRFLTASLIVFGLSQLAAPAVAAARRTAADRREVGGGVLTAPSRSLDDVTPWRWPVVVAAFGSVLAMTVAVLLVNALADPSLQTFYGVKNEILAPLGASNYLAGFLLLSALLTTVVATEDRRFVVFGAVSMLGLLATLSRGATLVAIIVAITVALARRSRAVVAAFALTGMVAALAFVTVWAGVDPSPAADDSFAAGPVITAAEITAEEDAASRGQNSRVDDVFFSPTGKRMELYGRAWDTFLDNPVAGVGINRFATVTQDLDSPHVNAHNMLLHALATTGLVGTLAYLALWGLLAMRLFRARSGALRAALAAAAGGLFLHAQLEALAFTRSIEVVLAVLLVLAATLPGADSTRTLRLGARTEPATV